MEDLGSEYASFMDDDEGHFNMGTYSCYNNKIIELNITHGTRVA